MSNYSIGLSGLNANSGAIDTISNNIANASTVGYKAGEFIFQDQFYKAINPLDPARAGQGAARQTIRRVFNMGTVQDSQNTLDMAITGATGMFRLADGSDPNTTYYTRNGQFAVSKDTDPNFPKRSYIVNQNGMFLTGYTSQDGSTLSDDWTGRITMPPTELEPKTTTLSTVAVNLDARTNTFLPSGSVPFDPNTATSYNNRISQTVYSADDNGGAHTLQLYYRRVDDQDVTVTYDGSNFTLPASAVAKNPMGASQINVVLTNDTSEGVTLVSQGNRATVAQGSVTGGSVINVANAANITQYSRLLVNGIDREATVASVQATGGAITTARDSTTSVAQKEALALSGTFAVDDVITLTVSGVDLAYTVTAADLSANGDGTGGNIDGDSETAYLHIAQNIATAYNSSPNSAHAVITATAANGVVSFAADTAGDAFTLTVSDDGDGALTKATANVAQQGTVKLSGTFAAGDILTLTVGGVALNYTVVANDLTADGAGGGGAVAGNTATAYANIAAKIVAAYNASTDAAHTPVTASAGPSQIFLTADTAGEPFTLAVGDTSTSGALSVSTVNVAQVDTVTLSGTYAANDVVQLTVGGVALSYTVVANDLTADGVGGGGAVAGNSATAYDNIAAKVVAAYNASTDAAHTPVTASSSGAVISLTADTAGVSFSASAATSQTDTVTLSGTFAADDVLTLTVGGVALNYTVVTNDLTADGVGGAAVAGNSATAYSNIAAKVVAAYNLSTDAAHTPLTASSSGAVITLRSDSPGVDFTLVSSYSNAGGGTGARSDASNLTDGATRAASVQNQIVTGNQTVVSNNTAYTAQISGDFAEGDVISLTINGVNLDYTVTSLDVANGGGASDWGTIATNLADAFSRSLVPGHQNISATVSGAVITFDADTATEFSAGGSMAGSGSVTLGGTIDISDGDRVQFFNPATTASGVTSTGTGLNTATLSSSNSAVEVGQYVFKVVSGEAVRVVDAAGDPVKVTGISGTTLTLSAVPDVDFANNTLVFYNPVAYSLTMQDGSKVSMSGDLFSGSTGQEFTAVTTKYEVYGSLDDHFFNSGNNNFYSDIDFPDPVGNGTYNPIAELSFWGGKNVDALVTNPVTGLPTFQSQVTLTAKVTTPGNTPQNTDPDLIFDLDLTGSRNFATPFGVDQSTQDGRSVALLNSVTIDDTGKLVGTYGDGRTYLAGQVVLVNFAATDGLVPSGNNVFTSSYLSGDEVAESVIVGKPGDRGLGGIRAGAVEGSNVDLANELVKLLIQQRMYSANSQSIRAFDDTLTTTIRMAGG